MRTIVLLLASVLSLPTVASAGTSCFTIEDPDQRAYCRAVSTKSVGQCSSIASYSLRQTCRAEVGGNKTSCNTITSQWEREKCRRGAERK